MFVKFIKWNICLSIISQINYNIFFTKHKVIGSNELTFNFMNFLNFQLFNTLPPNALP